MTEPARWLPDPYGRYQQRYFDGDNWTAHVVQDGTQSIDPLGSTLSIPFAAPTSAGPANVGQVASGQAEAGGAQVSGFLNTLGTDARVRPDVDLPIAMSGVGGAVAAVGLAAGIIGDNGSRTTTIIAGLVITAIAYAIRLLVVSQPELRSAAVGAGVVGVPAVAIGIAGGSGGGGTLVLVGVLLVAAWALPGMRGRPLMLGTGAVALVLSLATVGDDSASTGPFNFNAASVVRRQAWLFVVVAIVLLGAVWWLDRHGFRGTGTSLVVAALLASALASVKVIENLGSTGSTLLLAIAGVAVAVVGDHGERRATTWFGVGVGAAGVIAFFASEFTPNSTGDLTETLLIASAVLIAGPAIIKRVRASRHDSPPALPSA
jgi:hypothetical protein